MSSTAFQNNLAPTTKGDVGLGNADNTSDANKPVSTATQTALDAKLTSVPTNYSGWVKITKGFADFSTGALTNTINIYSLVAKGVMHATFVNATTKFSGGLIATATLSIGVSGGSAVKYLAATNVFTGAPLATPTSTTGVESMSGATNITATLISTVANLSSLSAGSVDIYLLVSTLP